MRERTRIGRERGEGWDWVRGGALTSNGARFRSEGVVHKDVVELKIQIETTDRGGKIGLP
jgi:hypothetical protein